LAVDAVLLTALAKDPAARYPSCSAFAADLQAHIAAAPPIKTLAYPPTSQPAPAVIPKRRSSWVSWALAILLFIGGVAAMVFGVTTYLNRRPAEQPKAPVEAKTEPKAEPDEVKEAVKPAAPAPVKKPAPIAAIRLNARDGLKYAHIPAGAFMMGCLPTEVDCGIFAKPRHRVTIGKDFWMSQTETTTGAYKTFAHATHREMPRAPKFNPDWSLDDHPMVDVSWEDAAAYCSWAGGRLPTEAEWEYAARGGSATACPWGDAPSHEYANYGQGTGGNDEKGAVEGRDQWLYTSPVASFPPNGFHLYDMLGNAGEWCADWFGERFYSKSPERDPNGPPTGVARVVRGGSWQSPPKFIRASFRGNRKPEERGTSLGFRCAANALP
jgi:formylglycine-generating enzyme required for sulfatase activity